jgi:hypothetical protein
LLWIQKKLTKVKRRQHKDDRLTLFQTTSLFIFYLVKAKGLVQQWAQLRYGVFEEHGFPNDDLLPYFYRHPDGYDAVSSSNDTEIKGNLKRLEKKIPKSISTV